MTDGVLDPERSPGVSIVANAERETLRARGPDALAWLNGLVSADLKRLGPRTGVYSLLLTKTGKIRTDLDVLAGDGELVLGLAAGASEAVKAVLDAHLVMEDVELEAAPELSWVRLFGARAAELALAIQSPVVARGAIDWLGIGGAALVVSGEVLSDTVKALEAEGARVISPSDWDALRLAHGFPMFGRDYGTEDNPHEAALDRRAVSWDKGCYLGQEVVCMQDMRGKLKRRLAVLRIDAPALPPPGEPVRAGDSTDPVGEVKSAALADGRVLAFARLRAPYFDHEPQGSEAGEREGEHANRSPNGPLSVGGRPAEIVAFRAP